MWFLFGVVTVVACALVLAHARGPAGWDGALQRLETGEEYRIEVRENKGKRTGLTLGVSCPPGFVLTLRPENETDRFFKRLGVSNEFATRDREFDDRVYVVAEDRRVGGVLYRDAEVRRALLRLFSLDSLGLRLRAVHCHNGQLWAEYAGTTQRPDAMVAREVVPGLLAFAKALDAHGGAAPPEPDLFVRKAAVLGAVAGAFVLNGLIQWYRADFVVFPSVIDERRWLRTSIAVAVVLLGGLTMTALLWMKRSARTHLVVMEVGLVGLFGCVSTSLSAVRDLNHALDRTAAQTVETEVVAKHGSGRRSLACHVSVRDWQREGGWLRLRVPASVHDSLPDGWLQNGWLRLDVGGGALGIRYLANAVPIPAPVPTAPGGTETP